MHQSGQRALLDDAVRRMEDAFGYTFEEGLNLRCGTMMHLAEPIKAAFKPLTFYLASEAVALVKHAALLGAGFKCRRAPGFWYYTYGLAAPQPQASRAPLVGGPTPVVFLHGVGAGLLPYLPLVLRLAATGHPVLAAEAKHLSMRWCWGHLPTVDDVARGVVSVLDAHAIPQACFFGHSYGTLYASRLLKSRPDKVHSVVLVDPVCCCMWSGHLIKSFVYNPQHCRTGPITWLIARDLHTAATVQRRFYWTEYNLWASQLPERSLLVLSGRDDLVPVQHVERMVTQETRAALMVHPRHVHASICFDPCWQARVVGAALRLARGEPLGLAASKPARIAITTAAPGDDGGGSGARCSSTGGSGSSGPCSPRIGALSQASSGGLPHGSAGHSRSSSASALSGMSSSDISDYASEGGCGGGGVRCRGSSCGEDGRTLSQVGGGPLAATLLRRLTEALGSKKQQ